MAIHLLASPPIGFVSAVHSSSSVHARGSGLSLEFARDDLMLHRGLHSCVVGAVAAVDDAVHYVISDWFSVMPVNRYPNNDYFGRGNFVHALLFSDLKIQNTRGI